MNDFWEWMEKYEYGKYGYVRGTSIKPPIQMLIGYMMEYLRETEGMIILGVGGRASISDVYEGYVKDIEKVERENLLKRMAGK